ncbi:hypothetical protein C8Q79DRAFT_935288 [Trametes meyenii]|nr:hypothetical protein C8Q79DRAFT_935288 [Trametes meyenii]
MPCLLNDSPLAASTIVLECSSDNLDSPTDDAEKPPGYGATGMFVPMSPSQNNRYERNALVTPEFMPIPKGLHSSILLPEPSYLAPGWSPRINPEGSPYYINMEKRVVTDAPLSLMDSVILWTGLFGAHMQALEITVPEDYELYLNPDKESMSCRYYLVDHQNQTVFWLEDIDRYRHDVDLSPTCSIQHMKFVLQEQYWKHCEFFPHRAVQAKLRNELINVFNQARADHLTSQMSTFPYDAQECKQFLQILEFDAQTTEYSNWILARLWATVSRHRYDTFYGEDHARISRDQRRYDKAAPQRIPWMEKCFILFFNMPVRRADELKLLFVDDVAFGMHWRKFAATILKDWYDASALAVGLIIIGTISSLHDNNPISACFGSLSVVLALGALASGALLLQRYSGADEYTATAAADHLYQSEHAKFGFEPVAVIYCAPRALAFWSIIFLAGHILSMFTSPMDLVVRAPAVGLVLLFALGLYKANAIVRDGFIQVAASPSAQAEQPQ